MPRSGNTTSPVESTHDGGDLEETPRFVPALTLVWNRSEPHRVGEVATFEGGGRFFLGREGAHELDRDSFRARAAGRRVERTGSLGGKALSRRQLVIDVSGDEVEESRTSASPR